MPVSRAVARCKEPSTIVITTRPVAAAMSEPGVPWRFAGPSSERDREGLRLLVTVLWIVALGAAFFAAITVALAGAA
jgi:hypothetical protein